MIRCGRCKTCSRPLRVPSPADFCADGTGRSDLREELDSGIDVVLTSYGTLASEFKKHAGEDGSKLKRSKVKSGLYSGASLMSLRRV